MSVRAAEVKARTLIEALPYIRTYRGTTVVVKIGGEALDDEAKRNIVADDLALLALVGIRLVVVHGGGPQVSAAMKAAGLEPAFVDGLRVTDEHAMEVVARVLLGSINPSVVASLNAAGLSAVGLSGIDGPFLEARIAANGAIGRVGTPIAADAALLQSLLDGGYTPVIASLALAEDGQPVNVNADAAAAAVAGGVDATKLVYLTNVEGLYRDLGDSGSLVSEIKAAELRGMVGALSDGMRPKVESAMAALEVGVGKVHILDGREPHALLLEIFTDEGIGTQVLP